MTDRRLFWRMLLVVLLVSAAWSGLGFRLAVLHLGPNAELREEIHRMWRMEKEIRVGRGRILDAHGNLLALDVSTKDVIVDPQTILEAGQMEAVGGLLARVLNLDPAFVIGRINRPGRRFEYIQRYVQAAEFERLERMNLPGVWFEDSSARYYPHNDMACHVIGFSNLEGQGSAGVELACDRHLAGRSGLMVSLKDGWRRELYDHRSVALPPREGGNVHLTLDVHVQYLVEEALKQAVQTNEAIGAWAVVEEVKTGRILAMASLPAFDLNAYRTARPDQMLNRVIGYTYEPGSVMKGLTLSAAFNEGVAREHEVIDCHWGCWYYLGRPLRDYHGYSELTVADVLMKSSNIGTAKIALRLGEARLEEYFRAFALGRPTGVGLPGEEGGLFAARRDWDKLSITRFPIGHGVAVTAMQMVNIYSAIANDGYLMKPYVVERITDAEGRVVMAAAPEVLGRPIREDTSRLMRRLLSRVTTPEGTARRAAIDGYTVAGKTGTAEKVVDGRYSHSRNIASFVGFLPAENPDVCILVVLDEPKRAHTGGAVAAPVFGEIAGQVVRCLHIPPEGRDGVEWLATAMADPAGPRPRQGGGI